MENLINIPHLEEMDEIHKLEQKILNETNIPVCNVSHWNSGKEYKKLILSQYRASTPLNYSDYQYSYAYSNDTKKTVISNLMCTNPNKYDCVFIHNATAAICCIADYLKKHGYQKICVIEPAYFSIYSCLLSFGLNVHKENAILNSKGEIELPYDNILQKEYDVVWITSPIFSTGLYFTQSQIDCINSLVQKGTLLIIDESAASPKNTLSSKLNYAKNIISIFSPHKYLAINAVKFAVIICTHSISTYIENWIDVFAGALPLSTCIAIEHYLSSNFEHCLTLHDQYIKNNMKQIQELCNLFPDNYCTGKATNYITICNQSLPYVKSLNELNIYEIMQYTYVSFVPGYINGFSSQWGFCYRVNLTLDANTIKSTIGRLFNYFS